ncbi:hypothetical protein M406DRAFT_75584 [Cryphonectria parasitica EP155]|uniref:Uncharacterized protein n=1 Tax=Cryphonectria parasitica (strain ATCC 38755 / EP155) TaxID=660469 RepID=A0A9P4XRJ1_CRYP1|nr:uncharacterized protein M406DRAFT_75584 [Cryphonectria parasitica EP155]KAF3760254.1 hypothetical protein M406DRAFT_75584 [Cryphonectria parasitica EP155]
MSSLPHTKAGLRAVKWLSRRQQRAVGQPAWLDEYITEKHPSSPSSVLPSTTRSDTPSARYSVGPSPISQTTILGEVGSPDAEYDADTSQPSSAADSPKAFNSDGHLRSSRPVDRRPATTHYFTPRRSTTLLALTPPSSQRRRPTRLALPPPSLPARRHPSTQATQTSTAILLNGLRAQVAQRDSTIAALKAQLRAAGATPPQPRDARGRFASPPGGSSAAGRKSTTTSSDSTRSGRVQRSRGRRRRRTQTELLMEAGIMFGYLDQVPNVSHVTGEPVVREAVLGGWSGGSEDEIEVRARGLVGDIWGRKKVRVERVIFWM